MINDLLFVIENHKGYREQNLLSTLEEFFAFLNDRGMSDVIDDIDFLLKNEKSGFQWKTLNTVHSVLEFRRCRDEQDLCSFLTGKYNDSLEKMTERGLHTFGRFGDFELKISAQGFSPFSISLLRSLKEKNPAINECCAALFESRKSLDDIIRDCNLYKQDVGQGDLSVTRQKGDSARGW